MSHVEECLSRAHGIGDYVLGRSAGFCEVCGFAPPYGGADHDELEVHCLGAADAGRRTVVASCSRCHRKLHEHDEGGGLAAETAERLGRVEEAIETGRLIVVTAAVIADDKGNVLVAKRRHSPMLGEKWEFPGGKLEPGERLEECLRREMEEEFSVTIDEPVRFFMTDHRYEYYDVRLCAMRAKVLGGDWAMRDHVEVRWAPPSSLKTFDLVPADVAIAEALLASQARTGLVPGARIEGYRIVEVLSATARGAVYRAVDEEGERVVLKEIVCEGDDLDERVALLLEALEFLEQVESPGVASILDFFSAPARAWVVMEEIEGKTLRELRTARYLAGDELVPLLIALCRALESLDRDGRRYVFGALTPDHVIVDPAGLPRLVNFGLGRFFTDERPASALVSDERADYEDVEGLLRLIVFMFLGREGELDSVAHVIPMLPYHYREIFRTFAPGGEGAATVQETRRLLEGMSAEVARAGAPGAAAVAEEPAAPPSAPREPPAEAPAEEPLPALMGEPPRAPAISVELPADLSTALAPALSPEREEKARARFRMAAIIAAVAVVALLLFARFFRSAETPPGTAAVLCSKGSIRLHSLDDGVVRGAIEVHHQAFDMAFHQPTNTLFLCVPSRKRVLLVDIATRRVTGEWPVRVKAEKLLVDPSGASLFAMSPRENAVEVLALGKGEPLAMIKVGEGPKAMAWIPGRGLLFVAVRRSGAVMVFDLANSSSQPQAIRVPGEPVALSLSPAGGTLWCAQWKSSSLAAIDGRTSEVVERIDLKGRNPVDLLVSPDGRFVYAALYGSDSVARIARERSGGPPEQYLAVGKKPCALAISGERLWVANGKSGSLSLVDLKSFSVTREVKTGESPRRILILP